MNEITKEILRQVADWTGDFSGAYSVREDGLCVGRMSTEHIHIAQKPDKPGLQVKVDAGTQGESVAIPACVTHSGVDDLVYNDFYIGQGADVTIIAGCGVHTETGEAARHNGIHRFLIEKGAHVKYIEKHVGLGDAPGMRYIDPVTEIYLDEGAVLEMDTAHIGGVDRSTRLTKGRLAANARLLIRERLLTEKDQVAKTDFEVVMEGENSGVDLISRAVARGNSHQEYRSVITGNAPCTGHSECDAIIADNATVDAAPELKAHDQNAALIHEAAIGKIAGEQIMKLRTLGLTEEEAEAKIVEGFLN